MNGIQHLLFLVSARFDGEGNVDEDDREVLEDIVKTICHGNCTVRKTLFITEGTLASLETAHVLAQMLCDSNESSRQLPLGNDFWAMPSIGHIFCALKEKVYANEDLWVFVGAPQYIFRTMAVFLPDEYEIYDTFDDAPSASCVGLTLPRKKLFRAGNHSHIAEYITTS